MYPAERPGGDFAEITTGPCLIVKQPSCYFRRVIFPVWLKPEAVVSRKK